MFGFDLEWGFLLRRFQNAAACKVLVMVFYRINGYWERGIVDKSCLSRWVQVWYITALEPKREDLGVHECTKDILGILVMATLIDPPAL